MVQVLILRHRQTDGRRSFLLCISLISSIEACYVQVEGLTVIANVLFYYNRNASSEEQMVLLFYCGYGERWAYM
jgi:hypothetical protein